MACMDRKLAVGLCDYTVMKVLMHKKLLFVITINVIINIFIHIFQFFIIIIAFKAHIKSCVKVIRAPDEKTRKD